MTLATTTDGRSRNLILTTMIFAVSMTFIDQTIISIAVPHIQRELGLSATGGSGRSTPTCWRWRRCSPSAGGWPTRSGTGRW